MKNLFTRISVPVITAVVAVTVIIVVAARAQSPDPKPYAEGQGAQAALAVEKPALRSELHCIGVRTPLRSPR